MSRDLPGLKIGFYDFWPNFQRTNNYFYHVLSIRHRVEVDQQNPDIALFSVFGEEHRKVRCKKYHFTGETRKAARQDYDYSFTFDGTSEVNCRLPLWVLYIDWFGIRYPNDCSPSYLVPLDALTKRGPPQEKSLFCNFIYNNHSGERVNFLERLAARANVDCLGSLRNNGVYLGGDEFSKVEAQRRYRFTIAFENTRYPGYVTEKILHAFAARTVPIYWGAPEVALDFNPEALIDARDYADLDALVDAVLAIDNDAARWNELVSAPVFRGGIPPQFRPAAVADFFDRTL